MHINWKQHYGMIGMLKVALFIQGSLVSTSKADINEGPVFNIIKYMI